MVSLGSVSEREVDDIMLTRYACYLVSVSSDLTCRQPVEDFKCTVYFFIILYFSESIPFLYLCICHMCVFFAIVAVTYIKRQPDACFWFLKRRKFQNRLKNNAKDDATGMIYKPVVCMGIMFRAHFKGLL